MKKLVLILLIAMYGQPAATQDDPAFEAYADARQVLLNSYFDINFTLKNGEGRNFQPPAFEHFVVISGPSRSASTTIINGQVSKELTISYSLKPRRVGKFSIGSATIEIDGELLRTGPVAVEVIEGRPSEGQASEDFFIRAVPSATEAYIGQQISLDYKLYTTINIESYNVLEESDYPGFYAEDLKRYNTRVRREIIDGKQYTTKTLKRVALFPQQAGRLTVDPLQLQLGIVEEDPRRPNSFFFNRKIKRLLAQTEPVEISVMPLPEQTPASFTGAVGQFSMTSNMGRTTVTTDDVLSLKLTISGNGDIKRVLPPAIEFPAGFEVYDPKVIDESTFESNGLLNSRKTFEYLALPGTPGSYSLKPVFSYFDPDTVQYITLREETYDLSVRPGSRNGAAPAISGDASDEPAFTDIRFIKRDTSLQRRGHYFLGSPGFWTLVTLPFLLLSGVVITRRVRKRQKNLDPGLLRQRRARKMALKRLEIARGHLEASRSRPFYDEISKALLGYVSDKLRLGRSELSKENVREKLQSLEVDPVMIDRFIHSIEVCERALFAGKDSPDAMQDIFQEALDILTRIEQQLKD